MRAHLPYLFVVPVASPVFGTRSSEDGSSAEAIFAVAVDPAGLFVVFDAIIAHQPWSIGDGVTREVVAVIKTGVTRDTQTELVFVEFLHALFNWKFVSWNVSLRSRIHSSCSRAGGGCSSCSCSCSCSLAF